MGSAAAQIQTGSLFSEEQTFQQRWIRFLMGLAAAGAWFGFIFEVVLGRSTGTCPAESLSSWVLLLTVGVLTPWLFLTLNLRTNLRPDRLEIRFRPLVSRDIPLRDIKRAYARTYRPIREYGGWGVRWGGRGSVAYNVSGDQGVQLELTNGKKVLIGSQRAEALATAIQSAMGR